jgi:hypothetical protein
LRWFRPSIPLLGLILRIDKLGGRWPCVWTFYLSRESCTICDRYYTRSGAILVLTLKL